jgi:hypothetical protein
MEQGQRGLASGIATQLDECGRLLTDFSADFRQLLASARSGNNQFLVVARRRQDLLVQSESLAAERLSRVDSLKRRVDKLDVLCGEDRVAMAEAQARDAEQQVALLLRQNGDLQRELREQEKQAFLEKDQLLKDGDAHACAFAEHGARLSFCSGDSLFVSAIAAEKPIPLLRLADKSRVSSRQGKSKGAALLRVSPGMARGTPPVSARPLLVKGETQRYGGSQANMALFQDMSRRMRQLRAECDKRAKDVLKLGDERVEAVRSLAQMAVEQGKLKRQLQIARRMTDAANAGL